MDVLPTASNITRVLVKLFAASIDNQNTVLLSTQCLFWSYIKDKSLQESAKTQDRFVNIFVRT